MKSQNNGSARKRVVVTGMGAVAPNGIGLDAYGAALHDGISGVAKIALFDAGGLDCQVAAEIIMHSWHLMAGACT